MFSEFSIVFPALVAGILIMLIHVPLGVEVIKCGVIFIDLAIPGQFIWPYWRSFGRPFTGFVHGAGRCVGNRHRYAGDFCGTAPFFLPTNEMNQRRTLSCQTTNTHQS
jgi:hypothetical protein